MCIRDSIGPFHDSSPRRIGSTGASAGRAPLDPREKRRERPRGGREARATPRGDEAVGEGGGRGVGGVEGEAPAEESADHAAHLLLLGAAGSRHGALDLGGSHLGGRDAGLGEREKQNAARLSEGDEALGIHAGKDALHGGCIRLDSGNDPGERAVQERETLGERGGPGRAEDPGIDQGGRGGEVDDGPARRPASGVDSEDFHRVLGIYSVRYFSSMSPFDQTFWTSSLSSTMSRSFRSAGALSPTSIVFCGTIWISAVWIGMFFASTAAFTASNEAGSVSTSSFAALFSTAMVPFFENWNATAPAAAMLPPYFVRR